MVVVGLEGDEGSFFVVYKLPSGARTASSTSNDVYYSRLCCDGVVSHCFDSWACGALKLWVWLVGELHYNAACACSVVLLLFRSILWTIFGGGLIIGRVYLLEVGKELYLEVFWFAGVQKALALCAFARSDATTVAVVTRAG